MAERRGKRWVRLAHGVYRPVEDPDPFVSGLQAWRDELPSSTVFTGLTAARVHGLWLPPLPASVPVFAAVPRHRTQSQRAGVKVARLSRAIDFGIRSGLLVADVPETLLACALEVSTLDLVVLIDGALRKRRTTITDLTRHAQAGHRGSARLRKALTLSDDRSDSAWESLLRLLHVSARVPVTPQFVVPTEGDVLKADLLIDGTHMFHEYDGADHRTAAGQARDLSRDRRILAAGYRRRGYTASDVARAPASIIIDACVTLDRDWTRDRMAPWEDLWNGSMFSDAGRAAAANRWS